MRHRTWLCVLSLSAILIAPASAALRQRRSLLTGEQRGVDNAIEETESSSREKNFYDFEDMTEKEKEVLAKAAYLITSRSNDIDWDKLEEDFVDAARRSASQSQSRSRSQSNDVAHDEVSGGIIVAQREYESNSGDKAGNVAITKYASSQTRQTQRNNKNGRKRNRKKQAKKRGKKRNPGRNPEPEPEPEGDLIRQSDAENAVDKDAFDFYQYSTGNCPDAGSLGVPCAPANIQEVCNKYDRDNGSFSACMEMCEPSICCIHDASRTLNFLASNCNTDENCDQYAYCYIAWWKLHDTIGPALFLRVEQDDEFYDMNAEDIDPENSVGTFFQQVLLHHWDDIQIIVDAGTEGQEFDAARVFLDPEFWDSDF